MKKIILNILLGIGMICPAFSGFAYSEPVTQAKGESKKRSTPITVSTKTAVVDEYLPTSKDIQPRSVISEQYKREVSKSFYTWIKNQKLVAFVRFIDEVERDGWIKRIMIVEQTVCPEFKNGDILIEEFKPEGGTKNCRRILPNTKAFIYPGSTTPTGNPNEYYVTAMPFVFLYVDYKDYWDKILKKHPELLTPYK